MGMETAVARTRVRKIARMRSMKSFLHRPGELLCPVSASEYTPNPRPSINLLESLAKSRNMAATNGASLFLVGRFRGQFFSGKLLCGGQSIGGGNFYVRLNSGAFPVRVRDGIDGASKGHANPEMLGDAVAAHGMCATAGGLANDGRALESLQVISELLSAGKGLLGSQNKRGLAIQTLARHIGKCPILVRDVALAGP